jgi:capsid protein
MQQKVAACFGAFVTDLDGTAPTLGIGSTGGDGQQVDQLEPGHIEYLPPGKSISFATPPPTSNPGFSTRTLRRIAAGLGVTYEDLTGDYSQVNFSSARMARLAHWQNVHEWRWHMLIPQLCNGVWQWAMGLAAAIEGWPTVPTAQWAAPPMPILEPDKEGLAYQRLVRIGAMTWGQMIRELGEDPTAQLDEIETFNRELDERGIVLDSDPRRTNAAGIAQPAAITPGAPAGAGAAVAPTPESEGEEGDGDVDGDAGGDAVQDEDESAGANAAADAAAT